MPDKSSRMRNIILITLAGLWIVLHLFSIIFDAIKHSKT